MATKSYEPVEIRLKVDIEGDFHGLVSPRRGDVVEVEPAHAARYLAQGDCQPAEARELGDPYKPWRVAA
jgi:hypothetical protein